MFTKLCIVKLIITILIMTHRGSCMSIRRKLIAPFKPANCFLPEHCYKCDNILLPLPEHEIGAWHFSDLYKTCLPHYIDPEQKNCCAGLNILPQTLKECEDMCGEPCIVTHANFKTEPGICMESCFIDVPPGVPEPCKAYNNGFGSRCCPRGYQATSFLLEEESLNFTKLLSSKFINL